MNTTITYSKPNIVILGSVEMICGTSVKGHTGVVEAIHWYILPAYDLEE